MYWRGKEEFDNMRNIQKDKKNERKRKETRQLKKRGGEERWLGFGWISHGGGLRTLRILKRGQDAFGPFFFFSFSWGMSGTSESKDDWRLCIVEARDCLFWARLEF